MIDNVVVLSGPYGVQYGPGLSFVAIEIADTPRYECCPEHHARILLQHSHQRRAALWSRDCLRRRCGPGIPHQLRRQEGLGLSFGQRHSDSVELRRQRCLGPIGLFVQLRTSGSRWAYLRYEQIDTEYPGQFFNIDDLITDGFNARLIDDNPDGPCSAHGLSTGGGTERGSTATTSASATRVSGGAAGGKCVRDIQSRQSILA